MWDALGWLQLLQKNRLERLPSALLFWLLGMLGMTRLSCVRRLPLRALLVLRFGTATFFYPSK